MSKFLLLFISIYFFPGCRSSKVAESAITSYNHVFGLTQTTLADTLFFFPQAPTDTSFFQLPAAAGPTAGYRPPQVIVRHATATTSAVTKDTVTTHQRTEQTTSRPQQNLVTHTSEHIFYIIGIIACIVVIWKLINVKN